MTKDEALKLALDFIEDSECGTADLEAHIKEALAQRTWVGLTDKEWHDIWEEFSWQHEDERHRRHEEFQNEMVAKHGAGHYYVDEDEDWNIQKDMIQKLFEDKLKEKNT